MIDKRLRAARREQREWAMNEKACSVEWVREHTSERRRGVLVERERAHEAQRGECAHALHTLLHLQRHLLRRRRLREALVQVVVQREVLLLELVEHVELGLVAHVEPVRRRDAQHPHVHRVEQFVDVADAGGAVQRTRGLRWQLRLRQRQVRTGWQMVRLCLSCRARCHCHASSNRHRRGARGVRVVREDGRRRGSCSAVGRVEPAVRQMVRARGGVGVGRVCVRRARGGSWGVALSLSLRLALAPGELLRRAHAVRAAERLGVGVLVRVMAARLVRGGHRWLRRWREGRRWRRRRRYRLVWGQVQEPFRRESAEWRGKRLN